MSPHGERLNKHKKYNNYVNIFCDIVFLINKISEQYLLLSMFRNIQHNVHSIQENCNKVVLILL